MNKVCIIGPGYGYGRMFEEFGWTLTQDMMLADMLQFTGGSDVTPSYYAAHHLKYTNNNARRDLSEKLIFDWGLRNYVPMAGICRGAQFLNVMCGGSMWQDVDMHAMGGTHEAQDVGTKNTFEVTSTHHQMMSPDLLALNSGEAKIVLIAKGLSTKRIKASRISAIKQELTSWGPMEDVEAIHYPGHIVFCFQPHPEFQGQPALANIYMDYLDKYVV